MARTCRQEEIAKLTPCGERSQWLTCTKWLKWVTLLSDRKRFRLVRSSVRTARVGVEVGAEVEWLEEALIDT